MARKALLDKGLLVINHATMSDKSGDFGSDFMIAMQAAVKAFRSAAKKLMDANGPGTACWIERGEAAAILSAELSRFIDTTKSTLGEKYNGPRIRLTRSEDQGVQLLEASGGR